MEMQNRIHALQALQASCMATYNRTMDYSKIGFILAGCGLLTLLVGMAAFALWPPLAVAWVSIGCVSLLSGAVVFPVASLVARRARREQQTVARELSALRLSILMTGAPAELTTGRPFHLAA